MDINPGLLGILAPFPMLLFFFFLMFTGKVVSGKRADRELDRLTAQWDAEKRALVEQWNARLLEVQQGSQYWREAHHTSEEIRANVAAQMETLRLNSELAVRVLTALPGVISIPTAVEEGLRDDRAS